MTDDSRKAQHAADYLFEQTTNLGSPITYTACLVMAKHILALTHSHEAGTQEPVATKKTYLKPFRTIVELDARYADRIRDLLYAAPQPASVAQVPNDAISAVMAEAYGMLGLTLTTPQARRLANAALTSAQQPSDCGDTDCEMAFIEACDEAGCAYDNEALLKAIADLKAAAQQPMDRETIARIIDPEIGNLPKLNLFSSRFQKVYAKADAILAFAQEAMIPAAWQYRVMYDATHARRDEWCPWRDAGERYFNKVNAEIVAGATRVQTRILYALPSTSGGGAA